MTGTRRRPQSATVASGEMQDFIQASCSVLGQVVTAVQVRLDAALTEAQEAAGEVDTDEARHIRDAYQVWLAHTRQAEGEGGEDGKDAEARLRKETSRRKTFAEQVGYVFFARLLLARVLEDKGLVPCMRANGNCKRPFEYLYAACLESWIALCDETFLPLIYRHMADFCRHFFQQPVFDWFQPDDTQQALVLSALNRYNFRDVSSDLLGFTYEAFIERTARNQKGHFLTPSEVVEFMLDRAGYHSKTIIGKSLLDLSCGSGSFLVHAARRLRREIHSALADHPPVERARMFIEQIQTRLVGLEINPFSCYLAELNLFIQALDDLALLWQHGERPNIERFAIYNTNSLEMPPAILQSASRATATPALYDEAISADEAARVKAMRGAFAYILCNPPYVNRGIILGAKRYGEYPFYRAVLKGDENFYLLFLRLAMYYSAPDGTLCFICPLNLLGDESTMRARELFKRGEDWSLRSITRFYSRTVLFPGVLQGVCVIRIDHAPAKPTDLIEIRGGSSVSETGQNAARIASARVLANYPAQADWSRPWLVHSQPEIYDLWEFIRQYPHQNLAELLSGRLETAKGDTRSTWSRPMLVPASQVGAIPLTKGASIADWGGWSAAAYLDPTIPIPSTVPDYKSSLWVQKNIQRIAGLVQPETALLLKEVSGLEMKRPIRGTLVQRSAAHPLVADETVLVMYTRETSYEELAYAVFGLITSSLYNFLFGLFSTNAHANFKEILRLPVPVWNEELEKRLAATTRQALSACKSLYEHKRKYGTVLDGQIHPGTLLTAGGLPAMRLEELVLRGDITLNGPQTHSPATLLRQKQLLCGQELTDAARLAIERLIRTGGSLSYNKGGKDLLLPDPSVASTFLNLLEQAERERIQYKARVSEQQQLLDEQAIEAYGIRQPAWKALVSEGLPWTKC